MDAIPSLSLSSFTPNVSSYNGVIKVSSSPVMPSESLSYGLIPSRLSFESSWPIGDQVRSRFLKSDTTFDVYPLTPAQITVNSLEELRAKGFSVLKFHPMKTTGLFRKETKPDSRFEVIAFNVQEFVSKLGDSNSGLAAEWASLTLEDYFKNTAYFINKNLDEVFFIEKYARVTRSLILSNDQASIVTYFKENYERLASLEQEMAPLEIMIDRYENFLSGNDGVAREYHLQRMHDLPKTFQSCLEYLAEKKNTFPEIRQEYFNDLGMILDEFLDHLYNERCRYGAFEDHDRLLACQFILKLVDAGATLFLNHKEEEEGKYSFQLETLLYIGAPGFLVEKFIREEYLHGNKNENRPLFFAVYGKNSDNVKLLLQKGANPYLKGRSGDSILYALGEYDEASVCDLFPILERYNFTQQDKKRALKRAVKEKNPYVVKWLCAIGADIWRKNEGETLLTDARKIKGERGNEDNTAIDKIITILEDEEKYRQSVREAIQKGDLEELNQLIPDQKNIEMTLDHKRITPFGLAASLGKKEIVKDLIAKGANFEHVSLFPDENSLQTLWDFEVERRKAIALLPDSKKEEYLNQKVKKYEVGPFFPPQEFCTYRELLEFTLAHLDYESFYTLSPIPHQVLAIALSSEELSADALEIVLRSQNRKLWHLLVHYPFEKWDLFSQTKSDVFHDVLSFLPQKIRHQLFVDVVIPSVVNEINKLNLPFDLATLEELHTRCDKAVAEKNAADCDQVRSEFEIICKYQAKLLIHNQSLTRFSGKISLLPSYCEVHQSHIQRVSERIRLNQEILDKMKSIRELIKKNAQLTNVVPVDPSTLDVITKEPLKDAYVEVYFEIKEGSKCINTPWTLNLETWQDYFTSKEGVLFSPSDRKVEVKKIENMEEMCEAGVHYLISSEKVKTQLTG